MEKNQLHHTPPYSTTDLLKDRDFIRQHDGAEYRFPRWNRKRTKCNILVKTVSFATMSIDSKNIGDPVFVAYWDADLFILEGSKITESPHEENMRRELQSIAAAINRVRQFEIQQAEEHSATQQMEAVRPPPPPPATDGELSIVYSWQKLGEDGQKRYKDYFLGIEEKRLRAKEVLRLIKDKRQNQADAFGKGISSFKDLLKEMNLTKTRK
jgi:hypothetical protein